VRFSKGGKKGRLAITNCWELIGKAGDVNSAKTKGKEGNQNFKRNWLALPRKLFGGMRLTQGKTYTKSVLPRK